ncbi:hypothetical protein BRADI_4g11880v3 [Brachypodium distachyon]|uniref:Plastocyanin-like domain-containing protein n=1 Tax=Brachypodium distachyon TaxID=15368 RepID=I1IJW5_BRADI|nr:hypothetical protein BRADI_4g11880v3 [Brachypodium distachyon]
MAPWLSGRDPPAAAAAFGSYPFPKAHEEIPIIIGEWWEMDLVELDRRMVNGFFHDNPSAAMINGKPGDLYNCSGNLEPIDFTTIAAELVRQDAIHVSQNMKIDAAEHVAALDNDVRETKLFHIGMKVDSTSSFT